MYIAGPAQTYWKRKWRVKHTFSLRLSYERITFLFIPFCGLCLQLLNGISPLCNFPLNEIEIEIQPIDSW